MPEVSRSQVFVYGAVAIALLLVGVRAIRAADEARPFEPIAQTATGSLDGDVTVGSGGSDLVVDVAGAVQDPGVYRLPAGSRVVDALMRAGGASNGAMLEAINRAARLVDGQQVVVPRKLPGGSTAAATGAGLEAGPISLGAATVEQLEEIDGIGPVTAEKIVEYRDGRGGLASVDQLDEVSGIGPATMETLRDRLQP